MDDPRSLLAELVSIDSINPSLVPGGAGETEIARFVGGWLEARGLEVDIADVEPGRPNVVARARGRGGGRTLLLNAHMDVVGVDGHGCSRSSRGSRATASTAAAPTT